MIKTQKIPSCIVPKKLPSPSRKKLMIKKKCHPTYEML